MSNASQLEECIYKVLLPLEEAKAIVDPSHIAISVDRIIDPHNTSPILKTYASIEQVKSVVRKLVAKRHDPVKKAQEFIEQHQINGDLFDDNLQPYYPVKRRTEKVLEAVYIPREQLTEMDVQRIAERMDKAGVALQKHARALQAWFISKAA